MQEAVFLCYKSMKDAWSTTLYCISPFSPLKIGRAMSFFPNSNGFVMNGGEFQIVNNEGSNKIEKGKHIFVHF